MTAIEFVREYVKSKGYDGNNDELVWEFLSDAKETYKEVVSQHRWYNSTFVVCCINDKFIGFGWADTTGDSNAREIGWEPDIKSICFCEPFEVRVTKYKKSD